MWSEILCHTWWLIRRVSVGHLLDQTFAYKSLLVMFWCIFLFAVTMLDQFAILILNVLLFCWTLQNIVKLANLTCCKAVRCSVIALFDSACGLFKVDWASNVKFLIKGMWSLAFDQMIVVMVKTQTDFNDTHNFRLNLSLLLKFAFFWIIYGALF